MGRMRGFFFKRTAQVLHPELHEHDFTDGIVPACLFLLTDEPDLLYHLVQSNSCFSRIPVVTRFVDQFLVPDVFHSSHSSQTAGPLSLIVIVLSDIIIIGHTTCSYPIQQNMTCCNHSIALVSDY